MPLHPKQAIHTLGTTMCLLGLTLTIATPCYSHTLLSMTTDLAWTLRLFFLGAASMTLGGAWLEWFASTSLILRSFPITPSFPLPPNIPPLPRGQSHSWCERVGREAGRGGCHAFEAVSE